MKQELIEVRDKYGDERQTEIVEALPDITREDMVKEEEVAVTITSKGYIKRTSLDQYKNQLRGGKGKIGIVVREEDIVDHLYIASTHSYILFFTNAGKAHIVKVYTIPEAPLSSKGRPIVNLINIDRGERVTAIAHVKDFSEGKYLFFATRKGQVKKINLSLLRHLRAGGIRAINLPEDDSLMGVLETEAQTEVMIATKKGMSIHFQEEEIRPMGRTAYGVRGIRLKKKDEVVSVEIVEPGCNVLTVTEKGYGKRTPCSEFRVQSRGGGGIINVRCGSKNGQVVCLERIGDNDEIILVTDTGKTIRFSAKDIPVQKRGGLGVKLMDLGPDKTISSVATVTEDEEQSSVSTVTEDEEQSSVSTVTEGEEQSSVSTVTEGEEQK